MDKQIKRTLKRIALFVAGVPMLIGAALICIYVFPQGTNPPAAMCAGLGFAVGGFFIYESLSGTRNGLFL